MYLPPRVGGAVGGTSRHVTAGAARRGRSGRIHGVQYGLNDQSIAATPVNHEHVEAVFALDDRAE
jgi:hypothetical protein